MLNLQVRNISIYKELIINTTTARTEVGLLDETEAIAVAKELILAAEDLLPSDYNKQESELIKVRESLEKD